jgi:RNA polymerase sigma-70 factor (ECF subfamily)
MQSIEESPRSELDRKPPAGKLAPHEKVSAVERAYRRHHALVFRLALRYGRGSRAWAEDRTQEVFVDLIEAIDELEALEALEGWLYRATTFRCLKRLRRERLMQSAPLRWFLGAEEAEPARPDAIAFARDDLKRAFDSLQTLPPKERVAFSMYYLDGRPQHEIGEVMGHGKSYVCKLLQRAVERLREQGWEVSFDDS